MKYRIEIDRLWRNPAERRQFEADTGLAPLQDGDSGLEDDRDSGRLNLYHEWFIGWAYRRLAEK